MRRDSRLSKIGAGNQLHVADVTPLPGDCIKQQFAALAERRHAQNSEGARFASPCFARCMRCAMLTTALNSVKANTAASAHPGPANANMAA